MGVGALWSTPEHWGKVLVLARVTYLTVCYPVTLVKPEHFMVEIFVLICRLTSLIPCCTDQTQSIFYPNSMEQDPTCLIELPLFPSTYITVCLPSCEAANLISLSTLSPLYLSSYLHVYLSSFPTLNLSTVPVYLLYLQ